MEVNATSNSLDTNILLDIFFCNNTRVIKLQFFPIAKTQFMKQFTIFYKHNLKTTHQLVQTSDVQVKVKQFSQKHVLVCQNLIFGIR